MWVGDVDERKAMVERPGVMYRRPAVHHNYERSFATKEIDQQLKKSINGEGL